MTKPVNQDEINMIIWKACDTFRGAVDPSEYKNYILTMLFVKYLSDLRRETLDEYARGIQEMLNNVKRKKNNKSSRS